MHGYELLGDKGEGERNIDGWSFSFLLHISQLRCALSHCAVCTIMLGVILISRLNESYLLRPNTSLSSHLCSECEALEGFVAFRL